VLLLVLGQQRLVALSVSAEAAAFASPCAVCRRQRRPIRCPTAADVTTTTQLRVSELHIPGYAQTKLPFLFLPEEEDGAGAGTTAAITQFRGDNSSNNPLPPLLPIQSETYIPYQDGYLVHRTVTPILSKLECETIVQEAEQIAASEIPWTTNRHGHYRTTDLPIVELPDTLQLVRRVLVDRIYPALRHQFGTYLPDPSKLRVADGFVVKYDAAGGQKELKPHRDGSVLSFNIALNPSREYERGGTWFASLDSDSSMSSGGGNGNPSNNSAVIRMEQGEMVSHASGLLHGGHGITGGTRYILVAFVILEDYDSWSMRFYNQIRNL
jgi:hypothetical protein